MKGIGTGRVKTDHAPKYQRVERERRYLLRALPPELSPADEHAQITDNYITGTRLRLRKSRWPATNEWTLKLTQKHAVHPTSRAPHHHHLFERVRVRNALRLRGQRATQEPLLLRDGGRLYSVDVFLGTLHGLVLAETDFDTDEELDAFTAPPPFAVADVSRDGRSPRATRQPHRRRNQRRARKSKRRSVVASVNTVGHRLPPTHSKCLPPPSPSTRRPRTPSVRRLSRLAQAARYRAGVRRAERGAFALAAVQRSGAGRASARERHRLRVAAGGGGKSSPRRRIWRAASSASWSCIGLRVALMCSESQPLTSHVSRAPLPPRRAALSTAQIPRRAHHPRLPDGDTIELDEASLPSIW